MIYLKCLKQPSVIIACLATHKPRFAFIICEGGGQRQMHKIVETDRPFLALSDLKFVRYLTEDEYSGKVSIPEVTEKENENGNADDYGGTDSDGLGSDGTVKKEE